MNKKIEEITLEIVELQNQLDQAQKEKNKKKIKHLLEKSKAILKIIAAGTTVPIAGTALTTIAGWNPFKLNEEKQYSYVTINIDKDGNIVGDKTYRGNFELKEPKEEIYYYTEWKSKDNRYERNKYIYRASEKDIKQVLEMIKSDSEITNDEIQKKFIRIDTATEYSKDLTEPEINAPSYVEALFEKRNTEDSIQAQETPLSHNNKLMIKIITELILILTINTYISSHTDYFKKIEETLNKEKPESKNIEKIKKKLIEKQILFGISPNINKDKKTK